MEKLKTRLLTAAGGKEGILPALAGLAGWAALAAALSKPAPGGVCAPFAAALAACLPLPACVAVCVGSAAYALFNLPTAAAAELLICAVLVMCGRVVTVKNHRFAPFVAPLAALLSALAADWLPKPALLPLIGSLMAAGMCAGTYFLLRPLGAIAARRLGAAAESGAPVAVMAVVFAVGAAFDFTAAGLNIGRIFAAAVFLLLIRGCTPLQAAAGGAIGGFILAGSERGLMVLTAALALGGMACCALKKSRAAAGGVFCLSAATVILCCSIDYSALSCIYELAAAALLACAVPLRIAVKISAPFGQRLRRTAGDVQAPRIAEALKRVGRDCEEAGRRLEALRLKKSSLTALQDRLCRGCKNKNDCWNGNFRESEKTFSEALNAAQSRPTASAPEFAFCVKREELYAELMKLSPAGQVARPTSPPQFSLMAELVEGAAESEDGEDDPTAGEALFRLCEKAGMAPIEAAVTKAKNGRASLSASCSFYPTAEGKKRLFAGLKKLFPDGLSPVRLIRDGGGCSLSAHSLPAFELRCSHVEKCAEDGVCGDVTFISDDGGRGLYLLSDGMGTGAAAALTATMALGIFERLNSAGAQPETALRCAGAALSSRTDDESLATFDGLIIDRFSAQATFIKAGAAVSYLLRRGSLVPIEGGALPLGIIGTTEFSLRRLRLMHGDKILMFSDGLDEEAAAAELTRQAIGAPRGFCEALAQTGFERGGGRDDVTVMLIEVI